MPGPGTVVPRREAAFVRRLRAALTALSAGLLASYFVLVLLQVFFRYVLNESLFWAEELVRGLLVWGVMVSSALVAASREHIRLEMLELMLPPAGRKVVVSVANALTIAFSLILLWAAHPVDGPHLAATAHRCSKCPSGRSTWRSPSVPDWKRFSCC